jgi:hypothetical protein
VQVFGGAVSMLIGSNSRSQIGTGDSISTSGDTHLSDCHLNVTNVTISQSAALSIASGNLMTSRLVFLLYLRFAFSDVFAQLMFFITAANYSHSTIAPQEALQEDHL